MGLPLLLLLWGCTKDSPGKDIVVDTDGDGLSDTREAALGSNPSDPCSPERSSTYTGFDAENSTWAGSDCDGDGLANGAEVVQGTNPYEDELVDSDGDGLTDVEESQGGSDPENPCDPQQEGGYTGYNAQNDLWMAADCDGDGTANGDELSEGRNPYADETADADGDGVSDLIEEAAGTDPQDPCDPVQDSTYTNYDPMNAIWADADCDSDGVLNGLELETGNNPYVDDFTDTDGDGLSDYFETNNGGDPEDPCLPSQSEGYADYDPENPVWQAGDCDADGMLNGVEIAEGLDPYIDDVSDTDGDGFTDYLENQQGSDPENACDPEVSPGYEGFDPANEHWAGSDCDADGLSNGEEHTAGLDPYNDERVFASTEFRASLSEMNVFEGPLSELNLRRTAYAYTLSTALFTDYAHKLRTISLPKNGRMRLLGPGLLEFPDETVITKTFFYYTDERNPEMGRQIIETRVLIKKNGVWEVGNYIWNAAQTEASLDGNRQFLNVTWTDSEGMQRSAAYTVPSTNDCISCHSNNGSNQPIGPKARALSVSAAGGNQLMQWIQSGILEEVVAVGGIVPLPQAWDPSFSLEERARAYMDVNCAHCHQPGSQNYFGSLDLRYETPFAQTQIESLGSEIQFRISTSISSLKMPQVGTSIPHDEGIDLINAYIDSLN